MYAMLHSLETCAFGECLQPATVEVLRGGFGATAWIGYCGWHSLRYDGAEARRIGEVAR